MPVLIAARQDALDLVVALAEILRSDGGEVRCYLEEDSHELRTLGCKIAVGRLDDPETIAGALTNAHTLVGLLQGADISGLMPRSDFAKALSAALAETPVEQVIALTSEDDDIVGDLLAPGRAALCVLRVPDDANEAGLAGLIAAIDDREETKGIWTIEEALREFQSNRAKINP